MSKLIGIMKWPKGGGVTLVFRDESDMATAHLGPAPVSVDLDNKDVGRLADLLMDYLESLVAPMPTIPRLETTGKDLVADIGKAYAKANKLKEGN